jgi:hypothetical protein
MSNLLLLYREHPVYREVIDELRNVALLVLEDAELQGFKLPGSEEKLALFHSHILKEPAARL